jgi:hypothetical protein
MGRTMSYRLDKNLLITFFGIIIAALVVLAVWTTFFIAESNPLVAGPVAIVGLTYGVWLGRLQRVRTWLRALLLFLVLAVLLVLARLADHHDSYQFMWLFSTLAGLLLARQEWPWWRRVRTS